MNYDPQNFFSRSLPFLFVLTILGSFAAPCTAQSDLEKALRFKPKQADVDYDVPASADIEKCRIEPTRTSGGKTGWIVFDGNGTTIRKFIDQNGDKSLDQLSYFKDGIEVYRDIDSDFDKKFDQFRWYGTAGLRWGIDRTRDGGIDSWKMISAEEVSFEVVEAIKHRDASRFASLVLSEKEIQGLGVGPAHEKEMLERTKKARDGFAAFAKRQTEIGEDSSWIHFGGMRPGIIPADTNDSRSDVVIYDSVAAVIDNGGRSHGQLSIGTLVRVGDAWRVIDLPEPIIEGQAVSNGALFFRNASRSGMTALAATGGNPDNVSEADQKLFQRYEELDRKIANASGASLQQLHATRANLFGELIDSARSPENRSNWVRQMADMVSAAYQNKEFNDGVSFLQKLIPELEKNKAINKADIVYAKYRLINSFYSRKMNDATQKELPDVQDELISKLEQFVNANPKDRNSADAMLQLALDDEARGNINEAEDWYSRILKGFPQSPLVRRARGAKTRLTSEGKQIAFTGTTLNNQPYDLRDHAGKIVLIQYWGTWCETCKTDMRLIKEAYNDYHRRGFEVVSVSLDYDVNELKSWLRSNPLPWTQLYSDGDLDSPLAEQLGIAMVPTMILVGADGKVIDRNVLATDIDRLLSRQFTRSAKRNKK